MESAPAKSTSPSETAAPKRNPWLWIPSLYFAEGIPYVVVMTMSVIMYKRLGISNTDVALYTSLLYLPWVLKPLWSPFVDIFKTKRLWIVAMQFLVAIALTVAAFSVQTSAFFIFSLSIFWVMAFSSSTHDIAADGFYMLGLSKHDQAWWVGIRSTFYRLAMIVGSGLLIMLAGYLESKNGVPPLEISAKADPGAALISDYDPATIHRSASSGELKLVAQMESLTIGTKPLDKITAGLILATATNWNLAHGFYAEQKAEEKKEDDSWWKKNISKPLGELLKKTFPITAAKKNPIVGNLGAVFVTLSKEPPAGKDVVVSFVLDSGDKSFKLIEGERFTFNSKNWNQPFMALIQLDPKLKTESSAVFQARAGNIPQAWSITLLVLGGLFGVFGLYHKFILPRPVNDVPVGSGKSLFVDFFGTLGSYFKKPGIVTALLFILLYRFAEAQSTKMLAPFLLDAREVGGLGLTTGQLGFVYGTVGIISLTLGGLFGGFLGARFGLKKMLPIMICAIHLPNLAFVYLSFMQPDNFLVINSCIAIEQFGYGFGFTAYMLYMLYFADGEHKTAHYAICTGFMALGLMLPGMWSGWLQEQLGYQHFFVWVILATIPSFIVATKIPLEAEFGKRN